MDPLTHTALGIACAVAASRPGVPLRAAALAGMAGGLMPDADVFLRSAADPLFSIEYHRHFTHSVIFTPVIAVLGALVAAGLLKLLRHGHPWRALLFPAFLGGCSHLFCDAWTSYGTRLWWPFAPTRVALDWISVVDPICTLPLVVCAAIAVRRRSRRAAVAGLLWVMLYLSFCLVQRHRASAALDAYLTTHPQAVERQELKASFGNVIVWRALLRSGAECRVLAIRCPLTGPPEIIPGTTHALYLSPEEAAASYQLPADSTQAGDIRRFFHFSDGWVGRHPDHPLVLGDLRYANFPSEISPLWGIILYPEEPSRHAGWGTWRGDSRAAFSRLLRLIAGKEEPRTQP